jgi:hypothetical protein
MVGMPDWGAEQQWLRELLPGAGKVRANGRVAP